jgi:hypothetical protein
MSPSIEPVYYDSETMSHWAGNEYYSIEGNVGQSSRSVIYIGGFPLEWATAHECGTGPKECVNCAYYGSVNGVFIGYCANCAQNAYKGSRGLGFLGDGIEVSDGRSVGESAFTTYLRAMSTSMLTQVSRLDVVYPDMNRVSVTEEEYNNMLATTYQDVGGPFNSDYEGGYNDF